VHIPTFQYRGAAIQHRGRALLKPHVDEERNSFVKSTACGRLLLDFVDDVQKSFELEVAKRNQASKREPLEM
jgi:hypothetical protein